MAGTERARELPRGSGGARLHRLALASWNGDVGVEAHAAVLGNAARGLGVGVGLERLDAIAQAPPAARGAEAAALAGERNEALAARGA